MIRIIVRLPMLSIHEVGAWLLVPIVFLKNFITEIMKPFRCLRIDQPDCHRFTPEGHISVGVTPSDFLRTLR